MTLRINAFIGNKIFFSLRIAPCLKNSMRDKIGFNAGKVLHVRCKISLGFLSAINVCVYICVCMYAWECVSVIYVCVCVGNICNLNINDPEKEKIEQLNDK